MGGSFGKVGTVKNPPMFRQTTTPISSTVGFGLKEIWLLSFTKRPSRSTTYNPSLVNECRVSHIIWLVATQRFFSFTPKIEEMIPFWWTYFSDGLVQPPTSNPLKIAATGIKNSTRSNFHCLASTSRWKTCSIAPMSLGRFIEKHMDVSFGWILSQQKLGTITYNLEFV